MTGDDATTVEELKALVRRFSRERDWEKFHAPKELGIALVCEVGELLEHFRYRRDDEVAAVLADPAGKHAIGEELADCVWLLLRLADVAGIDVSLALAAKVEAAALKYPIERSYGRADKYTAYVEPEDPGRGEGRARGSS